MTNRIKLITINALVLFIVLCSIELCFVVYETIFYPGRVTAKEFRAHRPEPYKGSNYFSDAFIKESFLQPNGWENPSGTRLIVPNDFRGSWFNTQNGLRATSGQPRSYDYRVLVFGGSTIYSSEVPDALTIPSLLQKLFNDGAFSVKVENYGASSVTAAQELERLKKDAHLQPKDIVVFYDGVNDIVQGVFYGRPGGWMAGEVKTAPRSVVIIRKLANYSAFFRFLDRNFLTSPLNIQGLSSLAESSAKLYLDTLLTANDYVTQKKAHFFHFFQPNLFSKDVLNEYEQALIKLGGELAPIGMPEVFRVSNPIFRATVKGMPFATDMTGVLDETPYSPYLDFCHVSEVGNVRVAKAIFDKLHRTISIN
jgi:hypothetical protein